MANKYAELRAALPQLQEEARGKGGFNPRAKMIMDLLAERDALHVALNQVVVDMEESLRNGDLPYSLELTLPFAFVALAAGGEA